MKNIKNFDAEKYKTSGLLKKSEYKKVDDGIYEKKDSIYLSHLSKNPNMEREKLQKIYHNILWKIYSINTVVIFLISMKI